MPTTRSRLIGSCKPRGGNSAYEGGTDARQKFWIKPLKETDLGVAQAFFNRWIDHVKTQTNDKKKTFNNGEDIIIKHFYP